MDPSTRTEIEAAVFRKLRDHLQEHTEVQNLDLMNLAGFCRNCLSKWYLAEAQERGVEMTVYRISEQGTTRRQQQLVFTGFLGQN